MKNKFLKERQMTKNIQELDTIICGECEAEYTVLHGEFDLPGYCPFCSAEIEYELDEDFEDDYFGDEDE